MGYINYTMCGLPTIMIQGVLVHRTPSAELLILNGEGCRKLPLKVMEYYSIELIRRNMYDGKYISLVYCEDNIQNAYQ